MQKEFNKRNIPFQSMSQRMIEIQKELVHIKQEIEYTLTNTLNSVNDYLNWYFNDKFKPNETMSSKEQFKLAEQHFEKVHETFLRNDRLTTVDTKINLQFMKYIELIDEIKDESEFRREEIGNNQNEIVKQMKSIEKRMNDELKESVSISNILSDTGIQIIENYSTERKKLITIENESESEEENETNQNENQTQQEIPKEEEINYDEYQSYDKYIIQTAQYLREQEEERKRLEEEEQKRIEEERRKQKEDEERKKKEEKQALKQMKIDLRYPIVKSYLSIEEMNVIEELTQKHVRRILFDSTLNNWSVNNSDFGCLIENESQLVIMIETTEKKRFGCYINNSIDKIGKFIDDKNAFIFTMNDIIEKYPIKDHGNAIQVFDTVNENLFSIGYQWSTQSWNADILIRKKETKGKCHCLQSSFNYQWKENALIQRSGDFEVERIVVIQMIGKEESERRSYGKRIIENENDRLEQIGMDSRYLKVDSYLSENELIQIENETQRVIDEIIFDSEIHQWSIKKSEFFDKVKMRSNLIFLFETMEEQIHFGCYISTQLNQKGKHLYDPEAFVFSLEKGNLQKYPIKLPNEAIQIFESDNENLFVVGFSWSFLSWYGDIIIKKKEQKDKCSCRQSSYDYYGKENALVQQYGPFELKRFVVVSTIDHEQKSFQKEKENEQRIVFEVKKDDFIIPHKRQLTIIEKMSGLTFDNLLFNSEIDDFTIGSNVLNQRIIGKKHLVFLIEDEDGEEFGYYFNGRIENEFDQWILSDDKSFYFNVESKGRLSQPMKYQFVENLNEKNQINGCKLFNETDENLIRIGGFILKKKNSNKPWSFSNEQSINVSSEISLCRNEVFTPKRLFILQLQE